MHRALRSRSWIAVVLVAFLGPVSGCAGGGPSAGHSASSASASPPSTSPSPAGPSSSGPARPEPPPRAGACHRLSLQAATQPTDERPPVPCTSRHTSITMAVGTPDQLRDGHLLAIDSRAVQQQLARRCPGRLAGYLGGDTTARRLSRFRAVWFGPTVAQADLGAHWSRCDVVAVATDDRLAKLPAHLKGVLDHSGALDRFGTCGTSAPDTKGFHRVICARKHSWRAIDVVDLPKGTHYLGKAAGDAASARCKGIAKARAGSALKYTWSFEWPSKDSWDQGQRYGYCWVPTR